MSAKTGSLGGRPRAFDANTALEKALKLFWQKGYEGTSLNDLTVAMGINKPSLYAAFGNKEQLFLQAIELYEKRPCAFFYPALAQKTAFEVASFLLNGAAASLADKRNPQGCVIVQGALACSEASLAVKQVLIEKRLASEQALQQRFERAQVEGDLASSADPEALSRYLGTVMQGMTIQATNGVSEQQLQQVAELALLAFPRN